MTRVSNILTVEWERPETECANTRPGLTHQIDSSDWGAEMHSTRRCSVDGCDRKHYGRGYCQLHYFHWRKHGNPLYVRPMRLCSLDGCEEKHRGHGLCALHLDRLQRTGSAYATPAPDLTESEQWLPVVGYEGLYEVSDEGRVRSLTRCDSRGHRIFGRMLSLVPAKSGHLNVGLTRDAVTRTMAVHRLVLEAFVGPRPEGMEGCHAPDPNPANNRLSNLRWDTRAENVRDSVRHGTNANTKKSLCPRGHRLIAPNLVPSGVRRGRRACLACNRAGKWEARGAGEFIELADREYARLMSTQATADLLMNGGQH